MPDNLDVPVSWIHYGDDPHNATGFLAGAAAFEIKQVLPGCYRLVVNLPKSMYSVWGGEEFAPSVDELKEAAKPYASRAFRALAGAATQHPVIQALDKVTAFHFPAQLCHEDCDFYGKDGKHEDVTVEKVGGTEKWVITKGDGKLCDRFQQWVAPRAVLGDPLSEPFLWDLNAALEEVRFMHCG